ncbi:hypothetical protein FC52_GL000875 [Lactobacillus pasteurii DSM 23907 = CRBIP 24.76]|uniref:Uncharacterized protein n=1 Tax=Lactobacillus pasteurii DSM 23907 = CRBIP 24.76 TaxID=1423790 RepID=I7KKE3_9LACO|nr:hypothetical protein FC52_GL000875 [Lactobacillus pasteurii DSM 23907 = CRBIP 24.76]CCI84394.1 Putative uncharacterized protein [Lactobacillus pasteurii DSM 23907 = CRBIP 24.76]
MIDGATKVIINSKGDFAGESAELKELAKLMNDQKVSLNEQFIWAQNRVNELNQDRRASIVSYETNKLDWTLYGEERERLVGVKNFIDALIAASM